MSIGKACIQRKSTAEFVQREVPPAIVSCVEQPEPFATFDESAAYAFDEPLTISSFDRLQPVQPVLLSMDEFISLEGVVRLESTPWEEGLDVSVDSVDDDEQGYEMLSNQENEIFSAFV
mmetsp:Transcript_40720/g.66052  ORF Transcript_40720/g.66052 Transcript_40720/m.66052 type:complete len:119 (-) Transcript_40720:263-619(-)|eukprot:CAMPEP_0184657124 /NCGR_PEP_ID=MMETSP0308-20130426/16996_1 /TAXON_ID=38269 /ORGANISM="Gloeochaete witrockiana, Strain SAG 46.84" /LENGTH=118 /DNA_ID=CAMNT_0027094547 /DNA_START=132 /DNA_END=488 /DNA_ORIENTATION=-